MSAATFIRVLVLSGGERLPALLDGATGQPLFDPLVYVTTRLRGRAANTIHQHVVALARLLAFCGERRIELSERIRSGRLLALHELDGLFGAIGTPKGRGGPKSPQRGLSRVTSANRLRAIRAYLSWLTTRRLHQLAHEGADYGRYQIARDRFIAEFDARLPSVRVSVSPKSGLTPRERERLLDAVDPSSRTNPWRRSSARSRNGLIVRLLYELGVRRGELLALRLEDFNARESRLGIVRRPDNPKDPRRKQPVVKTEERVLQLSSGLAEDLLQYVLRDRAPLVKGRHGFVFVATRNGVPLSASGLDKVFTQLRTVEGLPRSLTSHTLRHDWNDRFSATADEKRIPAGDEMRLRKYLQGWRWDGSAQRYNRRHVVKRANEALLGMQAQLLGGASSNEG